MSALKYDYFVCFLSLSNNIPQLFLHNLSTCHGLKLGVLFLLLQDDEKKFKSIDNVRKH